HNGDGLVCMVDGEWCRAVLVSGGGGWKAGKRAVNFGGKRVNNALCTVTLKGWGWYCLANLQVGSLGLTRTNFVSPCGVY
nr:hypothetical protein [Tanacetum cinerariifolium]